MAVLWINDFVYHVTIVCSIRREADVLQGNASILVFVFGHGALTSKLSICGALSYTPSANMVKAFKFVDLAVWRLVCYLSIRKIDSIKRSSLQTVS